MKLKSSVSQQDPGAPGLKPPCSRIHLTQVRLKKFQEGRAGSRWTLEGAGW